MYGRYFTKQQLLDWPTFTPELNFGYTTFDNFFLSTVPLFQAATLSGWSDIVFMMGDASNLAVPAMFFFVFILLVAFVILNLVVAVLEQKFHSSLAHTRIEAEISLKLTGAATEPEVSVLHSPEDKHWLQQLVTSAWFNNLVTAVIVLNTFILSSEHYPSTPEFDSMCEKINFFCTVFFCLDMLLRIRAVGVLDYFQDQFNLFDSSLVLLSIVELSFSPPAFISKKAQSHKSGISALRTLRLMRLFKLAKRWKTMQELFKKMMRSEFDMANFLALLLLFIYIMALVGMQLFANRYRFDELGFPIEVGDPRWYNFTSPRLNFDSLGWSCFTVFTILTLEDWQTIMYNAWRGTNKGGSVMYFIITIVFGQIILMNVFLAILISNFTEEGSDVETPTSQQLQRFATADLETSSSNCSNTVAHLNNAMKGVVLDPADAMHTELQFAVFPLHGGKTLMLFGQTHFIRVLCASIITHPFF